jgi:hypothetical protein
MRNLLLTALLLVITVALGYIFSLSGVLKSSQLSYSLPFGWTSSGQCLRASANCIPDNTCIAPITTPQKGIPFSYSRSDSSCQAQTNVKAEVADWVIYALIAVLFVFGFIGRLFKTPKSALYA